METLQLSFPEDTTPQDFFEKLLPNIWEAAIQAYPMQNMQGTEMAVEMNLEGDGGGIWTIIIKDGKTLDIKPFPYENAQMRMTINVKHWLDSLTGKIALVDFNMMLSRAKEKPFGKQQFDKMKTIKGAITVELSLEDGSKVPMEVRFNGADQPKAKMIMTMKDFKDLRDGTMTPQQAIFSGKVRIIGSMPLVVSAGTLTM